MVGPEGFEPYRPVRFSANRSPICIMSLSLSQARVTWLSLPGRLDLTGPGPRDSQP